MRYSFYLTVATGLALVGFGCSKPSAPTLTTTGTQSTPATTSSAMVIDETWDTYSSKAGFSFQFPTKGKLAPQWAIESYPKNSSTIINGCFSEGSSERSSGTKVNIDGVDFCVTRFVDPGAGQRYYSDSYTFLQGSNYFVITFTKKFSNGSMFDDERCHDKTVISYGTTCEPLDEKAYTELLDTAVKTFKKG